MPLDFSLFSFLIWPTYLKAAIEHVARTLALSGGVNHLCQYTQEGRREGTTSASGFPRQYGTFAITLNLSFFGSQCERG